MKRNLITSSNIGVENHIDYILKHISNIVLTLSTGPKVNLGFLWTLFLKRCNLCIVSYIKTAL